MTSSVLSISRRCLALSVLVTAGVIGMVPQSSFAYDENSTSAINVDAKGVAVNGYDVVTYFTASQPTQGRAEFSAIYLGTTYLFSTAANRDVFKQNPPRYVPQYGGFCAMGVALNRKFDGDPTAWHILDDKLYLNVNKDVQKKWLEDVPGYIAKSGVIWPSIKDKTPKSL